MRKEQLRKLNPNDSKTSSFVFSVDIKGNILRTSEDEESSKSIFNFVNPSYKEKLLSNLVRSYNTPSSFELELKANFEETEETQWYNVIGKNSGSKSFTLIFKNIVDQKSEEIKLEALLKSTSDLLMILDSKGYCKEYHSGNFLNKNQKDKYIEKNIEHFYDKTISKRIIDSISKAIRFSTVVTFEYDTLRDGKNLFYQTKVSKFKDDLAIVSIRDLTSIRETQKKLAESEIHFKSLFENSVDSMFITKQSGEILDCNLSALNTFNVKDKTDFTNNIILSLFYKEQVYGMDKNNFVLNRLNEAIEKGHVIFEAKCNRNNEIEPFYAEVSLNSIQVESKSFIQLVIKDIDLKKKLSEEVEIEKAKLFHASKLASLGEISSGVSHEINNPLTIINGLTKKLKIMLESDNINSGKYLETLTKIQEATNRISKVTNGLSSFAKDSENTEPELCQINDLIENTVAFCEERFRNHNIQILKEFKNINLKVLVKGVEISQVFLYLLNNSFDAIKSLNNFEEQWVKIKVESESEFVSISIEDSGPGIPESIMNYIMKPFYSSKSGGKGPGLGLSISKGIIESYKGMIYLDRTSKHTKFIITIPKAKIKLSA